MENAVIPQFPWNILGDFPYIPRISRRNCRDLADPQSQQHDIPDRRRSLMIPMWWKAWNIRGIILEQKNCQMRRIKCTIWALMCRVITLLHLK